MGYKTIQNNIITIPVLRRNYRELIIVFVAFMLMVLVAAITIGRFLRSHLRERTEEMIYTAEANLRAGLSEVETTLLNSYYIVQGMIEQNASGEEILDYLTATTEWMRRRDQGLLGFYGIYGYINGELYDSLEVNPDIDYIPQRRPWYQTAIRSGNSIGYTTPYTDWRTGETIFSVIRNIDVHDEVVGILISDININWLVEYVGSLALGSGGYGILLSQNMTIMAHPDSAAIGLQLQDLGGNYENIVRDLYRGMSISFRQIIDPGGILDVVFFSRIYKDWYVGIVIPYYRFYEDLYFANTILVVLGIVLSLLLCYILLRLSVARMRADEENKAKSSFLASMSHEIRTPMNAITGMAELLLRGELSDEARGYAQDIKQAGSNLISIINDILDFSKIEAGKLEIIPANYLLSSLINDAVNIIRMRLVEKTIRFFTNIDASIPNGLIGDEVRLRQILLNLLSNAVKYTDRGHISLTITVDKREDKQMRLKIAVTDTGKGMTPEDQEKLFNEFVQVDTKKNRGIEGTGLGLAITRRLCLAMGGDISVESDYGSGSTFTAFITQGIHDGQPFAAVGEPDKKKVLVYEGRMVYANSVCWSLKNMKVPHTLVTNANDFAKALFREEWFYIFSGYGLYDRIKPLMEQPNGAFCGARKPLLALMVEWGTEAYIPNVRFVSLPTQSLSIANILNGRTDSRGSYTESSSVIRFTLPTARILVVDDIATNLKVAEGLLIPYKTMVDTCLSGLQAIEMVKRNKYDIVFMDHMMPEMDGIEATAAIRALGGEHFKTLPIIALTANAVVGMREMFLEKDFNDFLAKPIDVSKLDEMLGRWIPKEKREIRIEKQREKESADSTRDSLSITGVDVQQGITMTGGTEEGYRLVLALFRKDAEDRLPLLQTMPEPDALSQFVTQVHALKGASASLGAAAVSAEAAALEAAGKEGNLVFIQEHLGGFTEHLAELVKGIDAALETDKTASAGEASGDRAALFPLFRELAAALKSQNASEVDRILDELNGKPMDSQTKETVEQISDEVLMAEFDKAGEILDGLLDGKGKS